MKFKPTKITILLLIVLLLTTSLNNAFGVMTCENGISSEIHHQNHHVDEHKDDLTEGNTILQTQHLTEYGDTCRDYLIQLDENFLKKKINVEPPRNVTIHSISNTRPNPANFFLSVSTPYLKSSATTSQTIIAHRTVVLLN